MPRKPNYSYERFQRETAKAAKKEAKRAERATGASNSGIDDPEIEAQPLDPSTSPASSEVAKSE